METKDFLRAVAVFSMDLQSSYHLSVTGVDCGDTKKNVTQISYATLYVKRPPERLICQRGQEPAPGDSI